MFGGRVIETEWDKRYRAGEVDTKKKTACILRDMGLKETDIARALEVSVSKVEEWLDPVPA